MTKSQVLTMAIEALKDNADAVEVLTRMQSSAAKQDAKDAEKRAANGAIKVDIERALASGEAMDRNAIATAVGQSGPKVGALLRQMEADGKVIVNREGKTNTYRIA